MSFMQRQVYQGVYYDVDTSNGSFIVPMDVCGADPTPQELAQYQPEMMGCGMDNPEDWEITEVNGFYGRYSAPGYLDCTDWCGAETEAELNEQLDMYGDDESDDDSESDSDSDDDSWDAIDTSTD